MVALVTLEQTKAALRIETNEDDGILGGYIAAASGVVINYLKGQAASVIGLAEDGTLPDLATVPPEVQIATILQVGLYYEGEDEEITDGGYPAKCVMALLFPLRDPALA